MRYYYNLMAITCWLTLGSGKVRVNLVSAEGTRAKISHVPCDWLCTAPRDAVDISPRTAYFRLRKSNVDAVCLKHTGVADAVLLNLQYLQQLWIVLAKLQLAIRINAVPEVIHASWWRDTCSRYMVILSTLLPQSLETTAAKIHRPPKW